MARPALVTARRTLAVVTSRARAADCGNVVLALSNSNTVILFTSSDPSEATTATAVAGAGLSEGAGALLVDLVILFASFIHEHLELRSGLVRRMNRTADCNQRASPAVASARDDNKQMAICATSR